MIPASNNFNHLSLTTSFIVGFNLRCGSREFLAFSFKWIRCVATSGLIPLISAKDYPIASLCSLKTLNNLLLCSLSKLDAIIIEQGSKYRISGSYQIGVFHIGYRISGEISGIRAHIGRSYRTLYIMKY